MALSILIRNTSRTQCYPLISKYLSAANKNVTTWSAIANSKVSTFSNCDKLALKNNSISILPAVRHMSGADHRTLWKLEKAVATALLILLPACVAFPCEILDNLTAIATVAHFHWGFVAIVEDYLRPVVVGKIVPPIAMTLVYLTTVTTLAGLLFFNYTDIGIGEFVRQVWAVKD